MDPLIEIPKYRWPQMRDMYRETWPEGLVASCTLQMHINCPDLTEAFGFKVFCPDGDINNGMVGWTDSNKVHFELLIHPLRNTNDAIEKAVQKTKLIDWNKLILVAASSELLTILERLKIDKGLQFCVDTSCIKHVLKRQSKRFENLSCPPNTCVGPLKPEHIPLVNKSWVFHSEKSHIYFEALMKHDLFYVLYSTDHKPLAWVAVSPEGTLNHLYCLEDHRRKGYAEFLIKTASNDLLAKDTDVLVYTIEKNEKPIKLFSKLGFEVIGQEHWVLMRNKC